MQSLSHSHSFTTPPFRHRQSDWVSLEKSLKCFSPCSPYCCLYTVVVVDFCWVIHCYDDDDGNQLLSFFSAQKKLSKNYSAPLVIPPHSSCLLRTNLCGKISLIILSICQAKKLRPKMHTFSVSLSTPKQCMELLISYFKSMDKSHLSADRQLICR